MLHIILASTRQDELHPFIETLNSRPEVRLELISSGNEALSAVRAQAPHLVILDANLPDRAPLKLVQELIQINALVNTAVVSPLSESEFHEASEGLGILAHLPMTPKESDATDLLGKLRKILGPMA